MQKQITVYTLDELSDEAKAKAIDKAKHSESYCCYMSQTVSDEAEFLIDELKENGFTVHDYTYEVSHCQGDNVRIKASIYDCEKFLESNPGCNVEGFKPEQIFSNEFVVIGWGGGSRIKDFEVEVQDGEDEEPCRTFVQGAAEFAADFASRMYNALSKVVLDQYEDNNVIDYIQEYGFETIQDMICGVMNVVMCDRLGIDVHVKEEE